MPALVWANRRVDWGRLVSVGARGLISDCGRSFGRSGYSSSAFDDSVLRTPCLRPVVRTWVQRSDLLPLPAGR